MGGVVVRARHEVENPCCIRHPMALTIVPLATHISSILRSPNQRTGRKRGGVIMVKSIRRGRGKAIWEARIWTREGENRNMSW